MELLKERIAREGVNLGSGILKVDSFINHQVAFKVNQLIYKFKLKRFKD
jgi:hypothetical protein